MLVGVTMTGVVFQRSESKGLVYFGGTVLVGVATTGTVFRWWDGLQNLVDWREKESLEDMLVFV